VRRRPWRSTPPAVLGELPRAGSGFAVYHCRTKARTVTRARADAVRGNLARPATAGRATHRNALLHATHATQQRRCASSAVAHEVRTAISTLQRAVAGGESDEARAGRGPEA